MTTDLGPGRSWKAELRLEFAPSSSRTVLRDMDFKGPLRVQRPFHPEGAPCHCYVLHPPGGLVSGDRLRIEAEVRPGAHALLTTPSAGKVYGADSRGVPQGQDVRLTASDGVIEWLPMETIVFDRAKAVMNLELELDGRAKALGWDIVCLGREAGNHPFASGSLDQRLTIRREGRPLLQERLDLTAGSELQSGAFGLSGHTVAGTLFAAGFGTECAGLLADLTAALRGIESPGAALGVTMRRDVLLVRYLGSCAQEARRALERAWALIRPVLLGRGPCAPRIWAT